MTTIPMMNEMNDEQKPDSAVVASATPMDAAPSTPSAPASAPSADAPKPQGRGRGGRGGRQGGGRQGGHQGGGKGRGRGGRGHKRGEPQDEFDSVVVDLARVTRVMAGGKRMSFRACVLVGDKKGRIGMGVKKGADVQLAVQKSTRYAKKHLMSVPVVKGTIPHTVHMKFKSASVMLKPGRAGSGIIAGGPVRMVMELAGIQNIVAKIKGSKNKINNLTAVLHALQELRTAEYIQQVKKS